MTCSYIYVFVYWGRWGLKTKKNCLVSYPVKQKAVREFHIVSPVMFEVPRHISIRFSILEEKESSESKMRRVGNIVE